MQVASGLRSEKKRLLHELALARRRSSSIPRRARIEVVRAPFVRFLCHSCQRTHYSNPKVGVALLITSGNSLLLTRRGEPPFQGYWTLHSGYVEYEESCEEAAIREAREELGLKRGYADFMVSIPTGMTLDQIWFLWSSRPRQILQISGPART